MKNESKLTTLTEQRKSLKEPQYTAKSNAWYQKKIRDLASASKLANAIVKERSKSNQFSVGNLYYYYYNPKTGKILPYYDTFPLVIVLQKYPDGFLGLNLHYLPVKMRAIFMKALVPYASLDNENNIKKLRVTYDILSASKIHPIMKPCVKRYLFSHVQTKLLKVNGDEYETAIWLPVQQFKKAKDTTVWDDSVEKIKKDLEK